MLKILNKWKRDENPMRKVDKDLLQSIQNKVDAFLTIGDAIDTVETCQDGGQWVLRDVQKNIEDIPTKKKLRLQLCLFCIYLCAASNKPMTKTDAGIISYILSKEYDLDLLNTYAETFEIDGCSFGCAIPETIEMFTVERCKEHDGYDENKAHDECIAEWCNQFIGVHRMLAVEYMAISGRAAEDQSPGEQYVNMLERYAEDANTASSLSES